MAIPSLALIPTGFKSGKLYSVLPESGAGDFDVVRGSGATRVNKDGLIETMASNEPRLDYTDGGCPSLLLEPQSTNLLTYSEDFSQWSTQTRISYNVGDVSPSGSLDATKIIASSDSNTHRVRETGLPVVTGDYTFSVFAKKGEYKNILLWDDTLNNGVGFNLDDGTIFRNPSNSHTIQDFGNGWFRLSITQSFSSQEIKPTIYLYDNSSTPQIIFAGNDSDGFYIWGAQVEALPQATSYIPTSGVIATRLTDSVSGAGDATTFNSTEGVLYAEMAALGDTGAFEVITLSDGSTSNTVGFVYRNTTNDFTAVVKSGGATSLSKTITLADAKDFIKVAISYKLNEFKLYINGVLEFTDTSGNTPIGLNTLQLTDGDGTSNKFKGKVKDLRAFNTALTDTELLTLTLPDGATLLYGANMADVGDSLLDQNGTQPILMTKYNIASNQSLSVSGKKMVSGDANSIVNQIQGITNSPKIILIGGGTNDFGLSSPIGELSSTDTTEYCGAVSFVLDYAIANYPDATILKLGLPFGDWQTAGSFANGQTNSLGLTRSDYMSAEKQLCEDRSIVYVNQLEELGWNTSNILDKTNDRIHPNAEGSQDRADLFSTYIDELFPPIN